MSEIQVIEIQPSQLDPTIINVGGGGGGGPITIPPPMEFTQNSPAAVWEIEHGYGYRPPVVALYSLGFFEQYGEYVVQHIDENSLRIGMETPVSGVAVIGR